MVVVAAVDRSEQAKRVVEEANTLARATGTELHVIHVLSQSEFVGLEQTSMDETGEPASIERVKEVAAAIADEIAAEDADDYVSIGEFGDISDEITRYAEDQNATYLVVGGRRRTPVGKAVFGSVTQSVLLEATAPVLTLMESAGR